MGIELETFPLKRIVTSGLTPGNEDNLKSLPISYELPIMKAILHSLQRTLLITSCYYCGFMPFMHDFVSINYWT